MPEELRDVTIVGGGPAGLSCALYAARAKLSTVVLDRAPGAGALAATGKIANYPGVDGTVPGPSILETMRRQATAFGAQYVKTSVMAVDLASDPKSIYASDGTYRARSVVIATGSMGRQERIDGEEEFLGRGVSYCVTCDAAFYTDRSAAVVGSDEAAVEEALFLARFAKEVHLVCPKNRLSAPGDLLEDLSARTNVTVHTGLRATRIVGEQFVTGITVRDVNGGENTIPVDGAFMLLSGSAPISDFLGGALKLSTNGCIEVDCNAATSVSGVYAVGDVTCMHPKQAIIAAAEGVIAALAIDKFLSGRDRVRVDYL